MPNTHTTLTGLFDDIADAIRSKTGGSADITADSFPDAIEDIPTGVPRTGLDITVSNGVAHIPAGLYRNNINRTVVQGSQTYTQNGTYDVRALAQAVVSVSGATYPQLISYTKRELVQAEDWLNNTKGLGNLICDAYLPNISGEMHLYYMVVKNNTASSQRMDEGWVFRASTQGSSSGWSWRQNYTNGAQFNNSSRALYISAGANITIHDYKFAFAPIAQGG